VIEEKETKLKMELLKLEKSTKNTADLTKVEDTFARRDDNRNFLL
jgi:hypothetical protein